MFGPHPYVKFVASYGGSEAYKNNTYYRTKMLQEPLLWLHN